MFQNRNKERKKRQACFRTERKKEKRGNHVSEPKQRNKKVKQFFGISYYHKVKNFSNKDKRLKNLLKKIDRKISLSTIVC
jgi:hypothetical protein